MLGAIIGDMIGSVYEGNPVKSKDFPLFSKRSTFTDDTILTVAVADAILNNKDYEERFRTYGQAFPRRGFGGNFRKWLFSANPQPYNSFGNGSAMRVSPVGWSYNTLEDTLEQAKRSAICTHNHPEGIKGAQATAAGVFMARNTRTKPEIRGYIEEQFGYDLNRNLENIRPHYHFEVSCQKSVPEALLAFLEADDFEDAIRNAVSLGGDSDTQACIAGAVAEAYYHNIPEHLVNPVKAELPVEFLEIIDAFYDKFIHY